MKTHVYLIASVLLALTSCGTTAFLSEAPAQKYQDGIYYRPQSLSLEAQAAQLTATDDLIARTKSSAVFVKTIGKVDTLIIPENMAANIKLNHREGTTTLSLYDLDDYSWYSWHSSFIPWYGFGYPYYWGSHRWYRNWYYSFYDPFWYDPFWYDPFWGPSWRYSYGFGPYWYDPFFYTGDPYFWAVNSFWGHPFFYGYSYYYGGGGYFWPRYHGHEVATRGESTIISANPRSGVGRVVRTGRSAGTGSVAGGSSDGRKSAAPRATSASRAVTCGGVVSATVSVVCSGRPRRVKVTGCVPTAPSDGSPRSVSHESGKKEKRQKSSAFGDCPASSRTGTSALRIIIPPAAAKSNRRIAISHQTLRRGRAGAAGSVPVSSPGSCLQPKRRLRQGTC